MTEPHPRHGNTKVMNRFDLTRRLVARLTRDEAVVGRHCGVARPDLLEDPVFVEIDH